MKKYITFIIKIILVGAVAVGIYKGGFYILWRWNAGPKAYDNAYQKALLLQYQALERERDNEIIVFGASDVPFGIDTDTMEQVTGEKTQILGIEAGIGISILVDMLYEVAEPGDTIVYMLGTSNTCDGDFLTLSAAFEGDKDVLNWYWNRNQGDFGHFEQKLIWRKMYALMLGGAVEKVRYGITHKEQVYSLDSFDGDGNMTALREGTLISTEVEPEYEWIMDDIDTDTLDEINEFSKWCRENDITFVVCYGMMIEGSIYEPEETLTKLHNELSEYLDADILLTPADYLLPVECFYNHESHLNSEGAARYSTILGNAINDYRSE